MLVETGNVLSHYRLIEKIGQGGMGVVWKAHDSVLDRDVAIKFLPDVFAQDQERVARFEREAKLLATLNHPGIAAIHGLEESDGLRFLVLEFVPGQSLADRLAPGPLLLDEALEYARQIAVALEAAHEMGVIHRDLKPSNIKVTPKGEVKVLDFGLAKPLTSQASTRSTTTDLSRSPTVTSGGTRAGVILGTAAYMSPEQARGKSVDRCTDIWGLGCVLYEMLTGSAAFAGETVSDTLAAVLKSEPDWSLVPSDAPRAAHRLLRRCLNKDARNRLHDAADARIEIENAVSRTADADEQPVAKVSARRGPSFGILLVVATVSVVLGVMLTTLWRDQPASDTVRRLTIQNPRLPTYSSVAISRDGRTVVFSAVAEHGQMLHVRPIDRFETVTIPGTENAVSPFFSPDDRWIAFFTGSELKKVPLAGGTPRILCKAFGSNSGHWGDDGTIIFSSGHGESTAAPVLARVSENGGPVEVLTALDLARSERRHLAPELLPGGKTVLFTVEVPAGFEVAALSLESGDRSTLLEGVSSARYSPTGHLIFHDIDTRQLLAVPFDPATQRIRGSPSTVADGVGHGGAGLGAYDFSDEGTLIYIPSAGTSNRPTVLAWVDRDGTVAPLLVEPSIWSQPRISPDGKQVLVRKVGVPNCDLWTYDLERRTLTRLTFQGDNHDPVWSPTGDRVAFTSQREATHRLYMMPADGSREAVRLSPEGVEADNPQRPSSWSQDGRFLAYSEPHPVSGMDIWILELGGGSVAQPFLQTEFEEQLAAFSPDGRRIAYQSNESGRNEIYVRAFPGPGAKVQVSSDGGTSPRWSNDGRELFFVNGDSMLRAEIVTGPDFIASKPQVLFEGGFDSNRRDNFDPSSDGRRFVMVRWADESQVRGELQLVLNWFAELKRLAPAR